MFHLIAILFHNSHNAIEYIFDNAISCNADVTNVFQNGYTPLHISAKKNQMDIAPTLLEYGAKPNADSKVGWSRLDSILPRIFF